MVLKISGRGQVPPFLVMDVLRAASEREIQGDHVLHMEIGQPSLGVPKGVAEAVARELESGDPMGYTLAQGLPALCRRIAAHTRKTYGVDVPMEHVFCTMGSSSAFLMAFLTAFAPGDRVGLAAPGYPAYRHILKAVGVEAVLLPVGADSRFQPTPEMIDSLRPGLDGLIVASPSNPTGSMLPPEALRELAEYCHDNGIRLISDEIYHGITYGMTAATATAFSSSAVVINSFSKYYCMTGWRLGWMVLPEDMIRAVECLAQNLFISPPTISQIAAVRVFDHLDELDAVVKGYACNRDILVHGLADIGIDRVAPPDGAFYVYADISHLGLDSRELCHRMLNETGIAVAPGWDFDPVDGGRSVRFSYSGSTATVVTAIERLRDWLPRLRV
ncbi:MAG: aminotransferase class I/II-fold pyridoxal phosphate-dependent enzyme [Rhodospirillaceae bacterium]|nr:aminotransferase class I/II-fold pyridoxal phosphate-dependent enzyme [Rhodospirillaceae bacterium]